MARISKLTYDRGSLILHPPPRGKSWIEFATWDDRVEKFRIPAIYYRPLIETLEASEIQFIDEAKEFFCLEMNFKFLGSLESRYSNCEIAFLCSPIFHKKLA